jgi:hypothetical protein
MHEYLRYFTNTGREVTGPEVIEDMYNGDTSPLINLPLSTLEACVIAQVHMLGRLHMAGLLSPSSPSHPS